MSALLQRKLSAAQERLRAGDLAGAQAACNEVLARAPRNPDALSLLAISHLMAGEPALAVPVLKAAVAVQPRHGPALENLGLAHLMLSAFPDAEHALRAASGLRGAPASVFMRLGVAILNQGRYPEAIEMLNRALKLDPANADVHLNLGQALARTGNSAGAQDQFEHVLRLAPEHADALYNLGVIALERDELEAARQWFERAIAAEPRHIDAMVNRGVVLQRQLDFEAAVSAFQSALKMRPDMAVAHDNLAKVLLLQGKLEDARSHALAAVRASPDLVAAQERLASANLALGRFKEAIIALEQVMKAEPDNGEAAAVLAEALLQMGDLNGAESAALRAVSLKPSAVGAYSALAEIYTVRNELDRGIETLTAGVAQTADEGLLGSLAFALRRICDWDRWEPTWSQLEHALVESAGRISPFSLLCEPTTPAQQLLAAHRWSENHSVVIAGSTTPSPRALDGTRLRIGYLSSDFHEHATAYLLVEVLELHDRARFEVFAYSYGPEDHSPMRSRLREACEHFVDIAREPDDIAARHIRNDNIDILIDLKGYTLGARTSLLARRLAPIQMSWIGYPGTMGAPFVDYLIADPFVVRAADESAYSEQVLRLPHCYQPNDSKRTIDTPLSRTAYGLPPDAYVFCCFNQAYKITPEVFACWMDLLRTIPGSVLWLLEDNRWAAENLRDVAVEHGIASERLIFAPRLALSQHLARYRVADLALDTFPYTSHTTASDALWAGCVLVSLCGDTFAARVSGSILAACNLPELITGSLDEYKRLALRLAQDEPFRNAMRTRLTSERGTSPLFDSGMLTRHLESLLLNVSAATVPR
jgi:protein O-GlcNAc transferase